VRVPESLLAGNQDIPHEGLIPSPETLEPLVEGLMTCPQTMQNSLRQCSFFQYYNAFITKPRR